MNLFCCYFVKMNKTRVLIIFFTSLVILFTVFLYYRQTGLLEGFEARTYDFRFKTVRGALEPHPAIVIVAIDDTSVAELGRFPWTRTRFAQFVDLVTAAGAKSIFLDAFFPEVESPEADQAFASALRRSGKTTLAVAFEFGPDGHVAGITRSLPALQEASRSTAHINMTPDDDGVVRWVPLLLSDGEMFVASYALSAARAALDAESIVPGAYDITVGNRSVPTDGDYYYLINYIGPPGTYPRYSFSDVINGTVGAAELKDKLVLVGATSLGIYDMRVTPFSNNSPGVEVHANVVDNILSQRFIQHGGYESLINLVAIITLGIIAAFVTLSLRHSISLPLIVLLMLGHAAFAYFFFLKGHWVSVVYPELSVVLSFCATAYLRFFFLDRKTRQIRGMFSSYVSKSVVDRLIQDPSQAKIGGENRQLTILFSDVQNYTGFSEKLPPEEVVRILNQYLAEMTHVIMDQEGTLDKFIGDGIMAFWGAPVDQPRHAELAVDCAVRMAAKMDELCAEWRGLGQQELSVRIGINSGDVVVGNIGAEGKKMEYTAIGDNVNLASRLEAINKLYGTRILISDSTRQLLPVNKYDLREVDFVRVKGKERPLAIFEVMTRHFDAATAFNDALMLYRQRKFLAAQQAFAVLVERYNDRPSELYWQRCQEYLDTPPDEDWDGSYTALRK
ncbi:MAG: adenylate/guanylate cyclase domain-containing protein [Desulfuromonadales bacterium]|nr:adenylate/guanylate cyclase domain-containing protein [Desulfuromonadales bacterium]